MLRIAITILGFFWVGAAATADDDPLLVKSRELTASFATQLQAALQEAMSSRGPTGAIDVCKDVAPAIASGLSRESGASVSRTSLKFRNPGNAPERWQAAVLNGFADPGGSVEYFERTQNDQARYMKAIPTGALCLTCHGSDLPAAIQERLAKEYPHDRARGYELGDIRGAFSVTWPEPPNEPVE